MSFYQRGPGDGRRSTAAQNADEFKVQSVNGDDDGRSTTNPSKKRYEIAIPTRSLKWANLARYLELEFKEFGVQIPKVSEPSHPV
jgi:hypothetical protein